MGYLSRREHCRSRGRASILIGLWPSGRILLKEQIALTKPKAYEMAAVYLRKVRDL